MPDMNEDDDHDDPNKKRKVPINFGSQMPQRSFTRAWGFQDFTYETVPVVYPGMEVPKSGPCLVFRLLSGTNRGSYYIHDRLSVAETRLLGLAPYRYRKTTGCRENELPMAKNMFLTYVEVKYQGHLGVVLPVNIEFSAILLNHLEFLDRGGIRKNGRKLTKDTIRTFRLHVRRLADFFGNMKLGEFDENACLDYVDYRISQDVEGPHSPDKPRRKVSMKQVQHELSTLRRAWNVYKRQHHVGFDISVVCPVAEKYQFVYLTRYMLSRYLWAIRGRIWNREKKRWRIARDDNPLLVGPEGDRRVLRPTRAIEARRSMGRMFLLGVYTGGRVGSMLATTYYDKGVAHVDWDRGVLNRRGEFETDSSKGRPSVLIMPKLMRNIVNWARRDAEAGREHLIHKGDGSAYSRSFSPYRWRVLDEDAGLGVHMTAHGLRHTCAMLLKSGGVSLWIAADFLGTTTTILEERYGTWDVETQREAIRALSSGKCLRTMPFTTAVRPKTPEDPEGGSTPPTPH